VIDEDTGDEPSCPYCSSAEDCPHLFAVLDKTFSTCEGGYCYERFEELTETVERAFKERLLSAGKRPSKEQWKDYYVQDLWTDVLEQGLPEDIEDDLALPGPALFELLIDVLDAAGGYQVYGSLVSESGAFCSSAMELFYAEDPKAVFEAAARELERRLADIAQEARSK
jgi:hypothetical protein